MTVWGVLLTAASTLLLVIGPLLALDTTAELIEQLGRQLTEIVQALGGLIGSLIAIYGLVRATQSIVRKFVTIRLLPQHSRFSFNAGSAVLLQISYCALSALG